VNQDCLKLTTYFAERDRAGRRFLADALLDCYEQHRLQTSVLLRGIEGFGSRHQVQTERLETSSLDLPVVSVAVDARARIRAALPQVLALTQHGLVTLERARMLTGAFDQVVLPEPLHAAIKLTVYCGRAERVGGVPAFMALVEVLHRRGVAGATVLLGVDGTVGGQRRRARFLSRNADVPLMLIAVGHGDSIAEALPELGRLLVRPLATLERVLVCKRDGHLLASPATLPEVDGAGRRRWHKLMVYAGEATRVDGLALHVQLIRRLLQAGASGASVLRGVWGYHGNHRPHGDKPWSLRRHVPTVTVVVDTPERIRHWFTIVDAVTQQAGLVTCEAVPAFQARDPRVRSVAPDLDWDQTGAP
jgi:PII-like signaling protein